MSQGFGSICWYCHWGWPKVIADIYDKAVEAVGENPLQFGPGHIVWSDENFERVHVQWCLDHFDEHARPEDHGEDGVTWARWALEEMLKLPDSLLEVEPKDYDGEHPENYPPPAGMEMVKR